MSNDQEDMKNIQEFFKLSTEIFEYSITVMHKVEYGLEGEYTKSKINPNRIKKLQRDLKNAVSVMEQLKKEMHILETELL